MVQRPPDRNSTAWIWLISIALLVSLLLVAIDARYSVVASIKAGPIELKFDGKPNK